jgi:hypothetical protein
MSRRRAALLPSGAMAKKKTAPKRAPKKATEKRGPGRPRLDPEGDTAKLTVRVTPAQEFIIDRYHLGLGLKAQADAVRAILDAIDDPASGVREVLDVALVARFGPLRATSRRG